ncbi:hypothetical protein AHGSH82_016670 [Aeromonas hydrophila]|nr:hypothetical protein AHGSH82_016670 [Aeromonas hydrophila]BBT61841.1 hypothetical protein WP8S18E02_16380 [Aeromonas hydrophila]
MKKTIVAMLVSGAVLFPGLTQAQTLEQSVAQSLATQGESVNILLNFTQFFETRIEYRFQIFTAHSCDFLLPSYARLA